MPAMPEPSAKVSASTQGGADAHGGGHAAVLGDGAHLQARSGVFLSGKSRTKNTASAKTMIHRRFQVIESWPISKEPDIQDGLPTSRLVGPKMVRTACCRISDTPQVASSVSSGRP